MKMRPNRRRRRLILWSLGMSRMAAFIRARLTAARLGAAGEGRGGEGSAICNAAGSESVPLPAGWCDWTDQLAASRYFSRLGRHVVDSAARG